ncbi:MAG: AAA family ATPase, partial [Candidatus Aenigmarchaeota archaeon]|nr:AAA family ATPase [Candidatus Aenigmarchaeota archaeon]
MIDIWTEKYRPEKLSDVVGQKEITARLEAFVKEKSMPHMLFAGSAGIGKTTSAIALAKQLYGDTWQRNFMETNASDERGIQVVRSKIKDFARTKPLGAEFKIIFLDESDALTPEAQQAMRRTMEKYTSTTRFILSCNYSSKLIPPIQSRCAIFRFRPIGKEDI